MTNAQTATRKGFVILWLKGTFIGWILGVLTLFIVPAIWEIITNLAYRNYREAAWYGAWNGWISNIVFYALSLGGLFLMGAVIGLAQWQIVLKGKVPKRSWVLSSAFSNTLSVVSFLIAIRIAPALFSFYSGNYSGLDASLSVKDTWFIAVLIIGSFCGIAMGIPKWLFLRSHFYKTEYWLLIDIATGLATFAWIVGAVFILKSAMISATLICCTVPIILGAVTGFGLYAQLQRAKYPEAK